MADDGGDGRKVGRRAPADDGHRAGTGAGAGGYGDSSADGGGSQVEAIAQAATGRAAGDGREWHGGEATRSGERVGAQGGKEAEQIVEGGSGGMTVQRARWFK